MDNQNDKRRSPIIGFYGYWVILTYLGIVSAAAGIVFSIKGNIKYAIICLMASGICDMLDGPVARLAKRTDREKCFGIQIDSFADIIAFGVFPAVLGYSVCYGLMAEIFGEYGLIITLAIMSIYILAALIRLAYFNVIEEELHNKKEKRRYFEGLPVTFVAYIIPLVYSLCLIFDFAFDKIYFILLLVISAAFLIRFKMPKLRLHILIICVLLGLPLIIYIFRS
ncbi:MAG: CDP-alcohol phosphatidyltransferase family protein [Treponema sp.]|nr:CDP-alcohol phosphatidyltransferase family protein [Treponema sp.]